MVERLAEGVYRLDAVPIRNAINLLLVESGGSRTLIDAGVGSSAARVGRALGSLGVHPKDLRTIYLTHHHSDHIGGLQRMRELAPEAEIAAFWYEAEILRGERERTRLRARFSAASAAGRNCRSCQTRDPSTRAMSWAACV